MKNKFGLFSCFILGVLSLISISFIDMIISPVSAETIVVHKLKTSPVLDGKDNDWSKIPAVVVSLKKTKPDAASLVTKVRIKAGATKDDVFFYIEWDDETEDTLHKPWVWDQKKSKYVRGPQREDRVALQFALDGNYSTNWFSGKEFKADMWHWKASRSNPLGLMHDKSTTISQSKLLRASKYKASNGKDIYITRPSDEGDKLYKTKRYRTYTKDLLPKYILADKPEGSSTDIKAKGVWSKGKWRVEVSRKRNTLHSDDVVFPNAGIVVGGIAVFDHSDNDDHVYSRNLHFRF